MEGTIYKFVEKVKLFQKNIHCKRYLIIDFSAACVYIKNDKNVPLSEKVIKGMDNQLNSNLKIFPFRNILDCYVP